jgi:hypothetical protein
MTEATAAGQPMGSTVLYDQNDNDGGTASVSQDFETANDPFDNASADDFVVPAGGWTITGIDATGLYFNGAGPSNSFTVTFYSDAGGLPGAVVNTQSGLSYTDTTGLGSPSITLATPVDLSAGTYWVSIVARMDFPVGGEWGWEDRTVQSGSMSAWENPGGGFGTSCATWTAKLTCIPTAGGPDFMFRLNGTTGGGGGGGCSDPSDVPWLSESPASGSVAGGASQDSTVTVNAASLTAGSYSAHICVATNDATHALVDVPVSATVTSGGGGGELLVVDLSTPNQVTISATSGTSQATVSGSTTTGWLFQNFFSNAGTQAIGTTTIVGTATLTAASVPPDGSPSLFRSSDTDAGLNIWSYSATGTTTFTTGQVAFAGTATWSISPALYTAMLTAPSTGNLYFPADDSGDIAGGAQLLGTYRVTTGGGGGDPAISVTPASLSATQVPNTTTTQTLTIANTGGGSLDWTIDEATPANVARPASVTKAASAKGAAAQASGLPSYALWAQAGKPAFPAHAPGQYHAPTGSLSVYTTLGDFQAAVADPGALSSEDFEGGLTGPGGLNTCNEPVSSASNDVCFAPGDLVDGFSMTSSSGAGIVVLGDGFLGQSGTVIGANTFVDTTDIAFSPAVTALAFDALDGTGPGPVTVTAFDGGGNVIGSADITIGDISNNFIGLVSPVPVASVTLDGANGEGELINDMLFGDAGGGGGGGGCADPSDVPWLSESPTNGSTAGGASTPVTVTFDSNGVSAGSYSALLCVASNDALNPTVEVPVSLTVAGAGDPAISVSPTSLNASQAANTTTQQTLNIANVGGGVLTWTIDEATPASVPKAAMPTAANAKAARAAQASSGPLAMSYRLTSPISNVLPAGSNVLYDQNDSDGGTASVSQDFETANDPFDNASADDFVVPAGGWTITGVDATGLYFNGAGPSDSFSVTFYSDAGGVPGAVVNAQSGLSYTDTTGLGSPSINLATPVNLSAGTYWVSIVSRMDFPVGGEWGWEDRTTQSGSMSAWENPGDGFGSGCTTWTPKLTCIPTAGGPDFMFRLRGTTGGGGGGGCADPSDVPWLSESPTGGSTAGGASTPVTVTFNSNGLSNGNYSALLCVGSNDAGNPTVEVPVSLTVGGSTTCTFPPDENFDEQAAPALPSCWTTAASGSGVPFVAATDASDTAPNSAYAPDIASVSDMTLDSPVFTPTAGQVLSFRHQYNLESTFDGAVLEISVNGGAFQDIIAAGGHFETGGYDGPISTSFQSPIAGRNAWNGSSGGFKTTVVDLPASAIGQATVLRFRTADDSSVNADPPNGWWVDTIHLGTSIPPIASITPASLEFTVAANATASDTLTVANTAAAGGQALTFSITARGVTGNQPVLHPHVETTAANSRSLHRAIQNGKPAPQAAAALSFQGSGRLGHTARPVAPWAPVGPDGSTTFQADDGSYETAVSLNNGSTQFPAIWMNRYSATQALTVDSISIEWPNSSTANGDVTGKSINLVAYYDADADGDPTNAVRLGTDTMITIGGPDTFETYPTAFSVPGAGDVYIGFVDQFASGGVSPILFAASLDENGDSSVGWVSGKTTNEDPDLENLANNDLTGTIFDLSAGSLPGVWMVRATGTGGGGGPCTGPVVTWMTASPSSGSVNAGSSQAVTVTVNPAAGGLEPGDYSAELCVTTNDTTHALVSVPVSVTVTEVPPDDGIFCDGFEDGEDGSCGGGGGGGSPGVYDDRDSFLANVAAGYYENPFSDVQPGPSDPLTYSQGGFTYTIGTQPGAQSGLYNDVGVISTDAAADQIYITFATPVTAVGGNFWATDISVVPTGTSVVLTLSDGTVETVDVTDATTFRGFVTTTPITTLLFDAPDGGDGTPYWSTLDNLIVGNAQ